MESTRLLMLVLSLLALLKVASSQANFNLGPFLPEGTSDDVKQYCTNLKCPHLPECLPDSERLLTDCAREIYGRASSDRCPQHLKALGLMFYEGYNDLQFAYCQEEDKTLYNDLALLTEADCWTQAISCLAPLHKLNETYQATHVNASEVELCKKTMILLKNCDANFGENCDDLYQAIRKNHYDIQCVRHKVNQAAAGPGLGSAALSSQLSLLLQLLVSTGFVLKVMTV